MSLSEDAFSDSSTNSESSTDLTSDQETISANPQRQLPVFSEPLPNSHGQTVVVNHLRCSMLIFSAGPSFHTEVQANHPRAIMPIFSIGSTSRTRVRRPCGSMPIFSAEPSSHPRVSHPRGSIPIFSADTSSPTGVDHPHGSMPIFSIGASSQTGVNHPRGSMPIVSAGSASRIRSQVAQDSPSVGRPIVNGLYDPNFAIIGLPVDPLLCQFMFNPNFGNKHK